MQFSFQDHLTANKAAFAEELIADQSYHALKELCAKFPFDTTTQFGFESRLGNPEAFCDFFFQFNRDSLGSSIVAGKSPITGLPENLKLDPLWKRITNLFHVWTTPGNLLYKSLNEIWLEFDYQEMAYNLNPNLFFGMAEDKGTARMVQWESMYQILNEIYRILFDIPFPEKLAVNLKVSIFKLPEGINIYQTGLMIPRQTEAVRLVTGKMTAESLVHYLSEVQWPGNLDEVEKLVGLYLKPFDYFTLQLNIGEKIHAYLGIEMYFDKKPQPKFSPRWGEALAIFESNQLVIREKQEALLRFGGKTRVNHLFPISYIRLLSHFKLVYRPDAPLECKGYFGAIINHAD